MRKSYLNRIKANISIFARKYSSSLLEGSYRSIYKGKSLNFDDLREYVVGDNVRDIDWKASARSRKLLIKQYIAEKQHNVMLILDTDKKMLAHSFDGDEKKDIALMAENSEGVVTVYAFGDKPLDDMAIQATLTEVSYV